MASEQKNDAVHCGAEGERLKFGGFHSNGVRVLRLSEPSGCGGGRELVGLE